MFSGHKITLGRAGAVIKAGVGCGLVMAVLQEMLTAQTRSANALTWRSVEIRTPRDEALNGIVFAGDRAGWIWAGRNTILATTDFGASWSVLATNLTGPETAIAGLWFMDENQGWAAGAISHRPSIWKTKDGGKTWSLQYEWERAYADSLGAILDIQFVDHMRGWAVGFNGLNAMIVATTDGGQHWKLQYSAREITAQFRQVRFTDALHGWALSYDAVMQTEDGGEAWRLRYFDKATLNCIDPISEADVWLAGTWDTCYAHGTG